MRVIVKDGGFSYRRNSRVPEDTELPLAELSSDDDFWLRASEQSLRAIWDNSEDDIYAILLQS
jgi:hypothetical protein